MILYLMLRLEPSSKGSPSFFIDATTVMPLFALFVFNQTYLSGGGSESSGRSNEEGRDNSGELHGIFFCSSYGRGTIKCRLVNRVGSDRHPTALVLMPADNNIEKSNDDDDQTSC